MVSFGWYVMDFILSNKKQDRRRIISYHITSHRHAPLGLHPYQRGSFSRNTLSHGTVSVQFLIWIGTKLNSCTVVAGNCTAIAIAIAIAGAGIVVVGKRRNLLPFQHVLEKGRCYCYLGLWYCWCPFSGGEVSCGKRIVAVTGNGSGRRRW